jgi:hypothetical protein
LFFQQRIKNLIEICRQKKPNCAKNKVKSKPLELRSRVKMFGGLVLKYKVAVPQKCFESRLTFWNIKIFKGVFCFNDVCVLLFAV